MVLPSPCQGGDHTSDRTWSFLHPVTVWTIHQTGNGPSPCQGGDHTSERTWSSPPPPLSGWGPYIRRDLVLPAPHHPPVRVGTIHQTGLGPSSPPPPPHCQGGDHTSDGTWSFLLPVRVGTMHQTGRQQNNFKEVSKLCQHLSSL